MLRFMKQEAVGVRRSKLATIDTKDTKNSLDLKQMEIGSDTQKTLSKLDTGKQKTYNMICKSFIKTVQAI